MENNNLNNLAKMDFVHEINDAIDTILQLKHLSHIRVLGKTYASSTNSVYIIATDTTTNLFKAIRISDHQLDDSSIDLNVNYTTGKVARALSDTLLDQNNWFELSEGFRLWYAKTTLGKRFSYASIKNNWWHFNRSAITDVEKNYLEFALKHNLLQSYFDNDLNREVTYLSHTFDNFRDYVCKKFDEADVIAHGGINVQVLSEVKNEILTTLSLDNHTVKTFWLASNNNSLPLKKFAHVSFTHEDKELSGIILKNEITTEAIAKANYTKCSVKSLKAIDECKKVTLKMSDGTIFKDVFISYKKYVQANKNFLANFKNIHTDTKYENAVILEINECSEEEKSQYEATDFNFAVYQIVGRNDDPKLLANVMASNGRLIENVMIPDSLVKTSNLGSMVEITDDEETIDGYIINLLKANQTTIDLVKPSYRIARDFTARDYLNVPDPKLKITVTAKKKKENKPKLKLMKMSDDQRTKVIEKIISRVVKLPIISSKFKVYKKYQTKRKGGLTIINLILINYQTHSLIVLAIQPKTIFVTNSFTYGKINTSTDLVKGIANAILASKNRIHFDNTMIEKLSQNKVLYHVISTSKRTVLRKEFRNDMSFILQLNSARLTTTVTDSNTTMYVVSTQLQKIINKFNEKKLLPTK